MTPEELREQINKLGTDMSAMMKKAGDEKRELTADEESAFDKMHDEREKHLATERRMLAVQDLDKSKGRRTDPNPNPNPNPNPTDEKRALYTRDALLMTQGWALAGKNKVTQEMRAAGQRLGVDITNREMKIRLADVPLQFDPDNHSRTLRADAIRAWEQRYQGVYAGGSPGGGSPIADGEAGGYTVANEMMRELEIALAAFGGMFSTSTIVRTNSGAPLPWPTVNDTNNEGIIVGEGGEITELDVVFGQVVFEAFKFGSYNVPVSVELMQDSSINMATTVGRLLGERLARIQNRLYTRGTGSSQPKGITVAAHDSGVNLNGAVTYDNLVEIEHACDPAYRTPNGRWMFHDQTLKAIKKLVDPSTLRPLWSAGMAVREPDTILGYPYTINQHMPNFVADTGDPAIVFGDLGKYMIRQVRDIQLFRLDEVKAHLGLVVFLAWLRGDGDLLDAGTHPVVSA